EPTEAALRRSETLRRRRDHDVDVIRGARYAVQVHGEAAHDTVRYAVAVKRLNEITQEHGRECSAPDRYSAPRLRLSTASPSCSASHCAHALTSETSRASTVTRTLWSLASKRGYEPIATPAKRSIASDRRPAIDVSP